MKVGITLGTNHLGIPTPDSFFSFVDRAEERGFDSLWVGDHIIWNSPHLEGLTTLSMYVARTKRLTLGTAILILPLRQPVLVARMLSLLSYMSGGRVIAGFGLGGENPEEFNACGIPHGERGQIMNESLDIIRRLWTEDQVSHSGKHFQLSNVSLEPKPAQLPIWLGGRSDRAHARAARFGDGWIDAFSSPRHFSEGKKAIEQLGVKSGFDWVQLEYIHVSGSPEQSAARAVEHLNRTYKADFTNAVGRIASLGPAEAIVERLRQFEASGATHVILNPTCAPEEKIDQLERIASEVLPLLRRG